MTWTPGKPALSPADRVAWQQWRKERKRMLQRERRARLPRLDYYPNAEANATVKSLCRPVVGGDISSVLNRIVNEWAAYQPPPEFKSAK